MAGAFPEGFYSTTNQRTEVRLGGHWIAVADQEMDCGIVVDPAKRSARCVPMTDVGRACRSSSATPACACFPKQRTMERQAFEFMNSTVSTEKPKGVAIRQIAAELVRTRREGGKTLLVGGPAIVHTGSGEHVCAADPRAATSTGSSPATPWPRTTSSRRCSAPAWACIWSSGDLAEAGHEHHLRAINRIRRARRHPRRRSKRACSTSRHHVRMRAARRRLPAGRQHPRRRPAARGDHRRARRPAPDARARSATSRSA